MSWCWNECTGNIFVKSNVLLAVRWRAATHPTHPFKTPRRIRHATRRYNRVAQTYTDTYLFAANSGAHVPLILFQVALVGLFQVACITLQVSTCDECNNVTEILCNHQWNAMRIKHSIEISFDDLKSLFFSQAASCKYNKKFRNTGHKPKHKLES